MRYLLILAILMMAHPVWAENEVYNKCMDKALTNYDIRQCNSTDLEILDAELNQVWRKLYPALPPGRAKTALLNEQRKWITFKDSSCIFWHYGFGTAGRDMYLYSCRGKIIQHRIKFLSDLGSPTRDSRLISNDPFVSCSDHKDISGILGCRHALQALEKNDAELNQVWREIRSQWKDDEYHHQAWEALLDEQRKWVAFKESACQYSSDEEERRWCLNELTVQRTHELKEVLENPEED